MFVEHLEGYFTDFGEPVVWGTATGTGIVDSVVDEFNRVLAADRAITAIAADWATLAAGDHVTVRGVTYTVRAVEPDGTGIVLIRITHP